VHRKHFFNGFQFQDDSVFDDYIQAVTTIQLQSFVLYRQRDLPFEIHATKVEFVAETFFAGGLQEPWPKFAMDINGGPDDFLS
jgi:hypothetical protein